jgi:mannitol 2-dehydrogenase
VSGVTQPGTAVAKPQYRPAELTIGIVHLGIGNFHRAHQAMYMDRLLNRGLADEWAICGVGLTDFDRGVRDALNAQGMQYTLVERHPGGAMDARSVASIVEILHAPDDPGAVIERLADPQTRIVTLTITEGGYNITDSTGEFDSEKDWIRLDVERGEAAQTVFGMVVEALRRRRAQGISAFTVVSCDNLPGNGDLARRSFSTFASLRDPDLGDWIGTEVPFPNSMVDRITPATTDTERKLVLDTFGMQDAWPVVCEDFCQWVLEDRFASGRPPLERVGVQLVADVRPYEKMKLRLLNGSHQAIAYFGCLMGYRFVHEAIADPTIAAFVRAYMKDEAEGTLDPLTGVDLDEYEDTVLARFANSYISDTLLRLATDASDRIPKFVLPVALERDRRGLASPLAAAIVASWAAFVSGVGEDGKPVPINDRQAVEVAQAVARQRDDDLGYLRDPRLFSQLASSEAFAPHFTRTYQELKQFGARQALERLLERSAVKAVHNATGGEGVHVQ